MGYQALLFCPDERAARAVTQVLSELDFEVSLCTEPFGAVKKMMAAVFDAVVVDCENEQNATLLFKSARTAANSQSALAVAIVEGQAGVAKAFRIGANLILTKPINVEQAKGTLRVARGLLRKNEATKSSTTSAITGKPLSFSPDPSEPVSMISRSMAAQPVAPVTTTAPLTQQAAPHAAAAMPGLDPISVPAPAAVAIPAIPKAALSSPLSTATATGSGSAAATAPAPEPQPLAAPEMTIQNSLREPPEEAAAVDSAREGEEIQPSQPAFSFEVNRAKSSGSKKMLLALAALVPLAAAGYLVWMQLGLAQRFGLSGPAAAATTVVPRPISPSLPANAGNNLGASSEGPSLAASSQPATPTSADTVKADGSPDVASATGPNREEDVSQAHTGKAAAPVPGLEAPKPTNKPHPIVMRNPPTGSRDVSVPGISTMPTTGDGLPEVLSNSGPAPTPQLQTLNISQGISRGLLIKQAQPAYPADALRLGVEGPVQLLATISKTGEISSVKILSGDTRLAHAAASAVKRWKYKPYLLNGEPVEVETQVTVNFKLPR